LSVPHNHIRCLDPFVKILHCTIHKELIDAN
jgi:hypothetical protein